MNRKFVYIFTMSNLAFMLSAELRNRIREMCIESAFGRLKARWRILTRPVDLKLDITPQVIYSCFVLHNYCQTKSSCTLDVDEVKQYTENRKRDEVNEPPDPIYSSNTSEGENIRGILTEYIDQNFDTY